MPCRSSNVLLPDLPPPSRMPFKTARRPNPYRVTLSVGPSSSYLVPWVCSRSGIYSFPVPYSPILFRATMPIWNGPTHSGIPHPSDHPNTPHTDSMRHCTREICLSVNTSPCICSCCALSNSWRPLPFVLVPMDKRGHCNPNSSGKAPPYRAHSSCLSCASLHLPPLRPPWTFATCSWRLDTKHLFWVCMDSGKCCCKQHKRLLDNEIIHS
mmetsp:Transcript_20296/g.38443  ORF Transcript_20296/g.38443 Transcript_20296/m.38443 type:complete len:211 (-) Transcript_20296:5-637(-)